MSSTTRETSHRLWPFLIGGLILLYLICSGPAVVLGNKSETGTVVRALYAPFNFAPHFLRPAIRSYLQFWMIQTGTATDPNGVEVFQYDLPIAKPGWIRVVD